MYIRDAEPADWPAIWPILHEIVAAGDTFTYDPTMSEGEAEGMWMVQKPGRITVAVTESDAVVGTANMYANRAGPGAHIASASYMVAPGFHGQGAGRALVADSLRWAQDHSFIGMQFNAVAETNGHAVRLYKSMGFVVIGTVPGAFRNPTYGDVGLHVMFRRLDIQQ